MYSSLGGTGLFSERWIADITYVATCPEFVSVAFVIDVFSCYIIDYWNPSVMCYRLNLKCCMINKPSQAMSHDAYKTASDNTGAIPMSKNKTIMVTGAGGQLATSVLAEWGKENIIALSRKAMDVGDAISCVRVLEEYAPDIVINCAAWTAVDDAQNNQESAFAANAEGAKTIARWCADNSAYLVHISTDEVWQFG